MFLEESYEQLFRCRSLMFIHFLVPLRLLRFVVLQFLHRVSLRLLYFVFDRSRMVCRMDSSLEADELFLFRFEQQSHNHIQGRIDFLN